MKVYNHEYNKYQNTIIITEIEVEETAKLYRILKGQPKLLHYVNQIPKEKLNTFIDNYGFYMVSTEIKRIEFKNSILENQLMKIEQAEKVVSVKKEEYKKYSEIKLIE